MRTLALLTLIAAIPSAHAAVYRSGDWELDDTSTRQNPNGTCIARTEGGDSNTDMALEIRVLKGKPSAVEVMMGQEGRGPKAWSMLLADGSTIALGHLGKTGRVDSFWAVPQKFASLIAQLEARKDLKIKSADGTRDPRYEFSAKGFAAVRAKLQERCTGKVDITNADFESAFTANNRVATPTGLTAETIAQLREMYAAGFAVHLKKGANSTEMTALRQKFSVQLAESAKLTETINRLNGIDIPTTIQAQGANDQRETNAQAELQRLSVAIPALTSSVTAANGIVEKAEAQVAPLRAEQSQRSNAARSARSIVTDGENRIADLDASRDAAVDSINDLNRERANEDARANSANRELFSAQQEERRATSMFNAYDPAYEIRRALDRNREYQQAEREIPRARQDVRASHEAVNNSRAIRNAADAKLKACQATAGADCSGYQTALNDANRELERLKDEERSMQSRLNAWENVLVRERNQAEREAEAIKNRLGQEMVIAQQRVNDLLSVIASAEGRIRDIINYEIPRLNDRISSIDRERPLVVSQVEAKRPEAVRLENEQAAFERRVGWAAKTAALAEAQRQLTTRTNDLNTALGQQRNANATIVATRAERTRLAQVLAGHQQLLSSSQTRLIQVKASLEPFEAERARIDLVAGQLNGQFADLAAQFASRLP